MKFFGTKNLTQHAYALVRQIASSQKEGEIYYWILSSEHELSIASETVTLFSNLLSVPVHSYPIDSARHDFSLQLSNLQKGEEGIYMMTLDTYHLLQRAISLLVEEAISISVGQSTSPQQLKKKLVSLGYSDDEEDPLYFSAKGETVMIKQSNQHLRLLFDDQKIESIVSLPDSKQLSSISVFPSELDFEQIPLKTQPVPKGIEVYSDQIQFSPRDKEQTLEFTTFKNESTDGIHFDLHAPSKYKRDFAQLNLDLQQWQDLGYVVAIATVDEEVIKTALQKEEADLSSIYFLDQSIPLAGMIDRKEKLVLLAHSDIFGRKQVKTTKRRDHAAFITKLRPNDYIVHEDHGIGRYLGMTTTEIEGHSRENLILEYAKGDRLYVPVELAYKVDRYIGEAKPKLQRLSGTSWLRLSRKATQESQEFAKDLLKLYAKRSLVTVPAWKVFMDADRELHKSFPFEETPDQEKAIEDVYEDLAKPTPMDRLVVGDVGFGKTEVAIRAAYQAVLNHKQVAVLCPTTLLAQQHYDTFSKRLEEKGVKVEMLSRFTGKVGKSKDQVTIKQVVQGVKDGQIDIVIGTHRLLSKDVDFARMGLVIIDEEQRFGVKHKEKLKSLRSKAHILTLSATPIPRTLYFSLSGLRNISTIQTPPKGRQPIETKIHEYDQDLIKKAITTELKRGGQAFYLYNKVQTITTIKRQLQELLGSKVKIDIVHGQMPATEMARIASEFGAGKIDVLVCTTIVENGLDLPNVNTLIVHNATRFGIGQLYQIRGRIGRGSVKAHALFLYPESGISGVAATRLQILEEAKELGSGFQLAMRDLEMRGMGQMLGKKQHGQIQKVGLALYGKLLRQAVEELETGEIQRPQKAVSINLPLDYGIPESLLKDSEERLRLYRIISQSRSANEIHEALEQYDSQIHLLEPSQKELLDNFVYLIELRFAVEQSRIRAIDYQKVVLPDGRMKQQVELVLEELSPAIVDLLIPVIPDFKVIGDDKIVYPVEKESEALETIKKLLPLLTDR